MTPSLDDPRDVECAKEAHASRETAHWISFGPDYQKGMILAARLSRERAEQANSDNRRLKLIERRTDKVIGLAKEIHAILLGSRDHVLEEYGAGQAVEPPIDPDLLRVRELLAVQTGDAFEDTLAAFKAGKAEGKS